MTDTTTAITDQPNLGSAELLVSPTPSTLNSSNAANFPYSKSYRHPTLPSAAVAMPPGRPKVPAPIGAPPAPDRPRSLGAMLSLLVVILLLIREAFVTFPSVAINVRPFNLTWIEGSSVLPSTCARCPNNNTFYTPGTYFYPRILRRDGRMEAISTWAGRFEADLESTDAANTANTTTPSPRSVYRSIAPHLF